MSEHIKESSVSILGLSPQPADFKEVALFTFQHESSSLYARKVHDQVR